MKCIECGHMDEFRSSRFDFEREVLENKHFDRADKRVKEILDELIARFLNPFKDGSWTGHWGYPTVQYDGFAWTMTSTGSALWRMPLEIWQTRGNTDRERWSPKKYFDGTNKTWTVTRKKVSAAEPLDTVERKK